MRGKKAAGAAVRRANAESVEAIETYRRKVRELSAEVKTLKDRLDNERATGSEERRKLRAQLAEGLSPELFARDQLIKNLRDDLGKARAEVSHVRNGVNQLMALLVALLENAGMTREEAQRWLANRVELAFKYATLPASPTPNALRQATRLAAVEMSNLQKGLGRDR